MPTRTSRSPLRVDTGGSPPDAEGFRAPVSPKRRHPMSDIAIHTRGLTRTFGAVRAVDGVDLEVRRGEVFGYLGHNGAGKTTTVRLLNAVLDPSAGQATVLGLSTVSEGAVLRARTGVLTETPALDDRLTARESLVYAGRLFGVPGGALQPRIEALLAEFDLLDRGDDRVGGYSKGMRQKLALARALIHEPELIFLDEPTSGLDPVARRQIHELIHRLARSQGRTVFLSTHNLAEAQQLCDRVAVLEHGRIIALGTPLELARRLGSRATIELDVGVEAADHAARILATQTSHEPTAQGAGRLLLSGVARDEIPALVERMVAAGVPVFGVVAQEPTLEDAYFALVNQKNP
jgi:ABC-2 type transport system ATP-binding protein